MIERKRIYEKKDPSKDAQKVYILCEGENREYDYFMFFKGMSSNLELVVIPPENGKTDPLQLSKAAERIFLSDDRTFQLDVKEKDVVWFVVDTDEWQMQGKLALLRKFCDTYNKGKEYAMWNVAQSNPCFEIWLYHHIYKNKPSEEEMAGYESMKDFVNAKIHGGFNSTIHPIYIRDAIANSEMNYSEDEDHNPDNYTTQVFRLGKDIVKYARRELDIKARTLV